MRSSQVRGLAVCINQDIGRPGKETSEAILEIPVAR
jgi:hypothetical protein